LRSLRSRAIALSELKRLMKEALPEIERTAASAAVPKDLHKRIADKPGAAWDEALHRLTRQKKPRRPSAL
jgi:hypothetical protein